MARLKSIAPGVGVTALALAFSCGGLFVAALWMERSYRDGGYALILLWPIVIPIVLGCTALGLCASHVSYRRALAASASKDGVALRDGS